jgi:hypothetical protein
MQARRALGWVFQPVLAHRRALLAVNVLYFGAVLVGIAYTAVDRTIQAALLRAVGEALSPTGTLGPVAEAYGSGQLAAAIILTFVVNLAIGAAFYITLPSLLIPFAGLLTGAFRGILWGLLFSPLGHVLDIAFAPHALTILLEGEAYVVAMLGIWLWWWPVLRQGGRRWRAWRDGLRLQGRIYAAVIFLLAVAAVYEALEVIYVIPWLAGG